MCVVNLFKCKGYVELISQVTRHLISGRLVSSAALAYLQRLEKQAQDDRKPSGAQELLHGKQQERERERYKNKPQHLECGFFFSLAVAKLPTKKKNS